MTCAFPWLCRLWKHSVRKQILEEFVSTFCALLRSTIVKFWITNPALQDAIDLKLNYHSFIKLNCMLFAQCIIFRRTNRVHWRSVIDSQLFMIKNKPTNSQRSKMTYVERNFAISLDCLHFPTFSFFKIVHSTEGNFLFGLSSCSWDHVANYLLK